MRSWTLAVRELRIVYILHRDVMTGAQRAVGVPDGLPGILVASSFQTNSARYTVFVQEDRRQLVKADGKAE